MLVLTTGCTTKTTYQKIKPPTVVSQPLPILPETRQPECIPKLGYKCIRVIPKKPPITPLKPNYRKLKKHPTSVSFPFMLEKIGTHYEGKPVYKRLQ